MLQDYQEKPNFNQVIAEIKKSQPDYARVLICHRMPHDGLVLKRSIELYEHVLELWGEVAGKVVVEHQYYLTNRDCDIATIGVNLFANGNRLYDVVYVPGLDDHVADATHFWVMQGPIRVLSYP